MLSRILPTLLISIATASTGGCIEGARFHGAIRADRSPVLELSWARAKRSDEGVTVWGQIQQVNCCSRNVPGHIHIRAIGDNGVTLSERDASWGDFIARQLHSASFKAMLPLPEQLSVSKIELQFITPRGK